MVQPSYMKNLNYSWRKNLFPPTQIKEDTDIPQMKTIMMKMNMRKKFKKVLQNALNVEANSHMMKIARNVKFHNPWKKKDTVQ